MPAQAHTQDRADRRARIYWRLQWRNRVVFVLRWVLPAVAIVLFAAVCIQMYVVGLSREFGISNVRLERDRVVVETPRYAGVMADDTRYVLTADSATAPVDNLQLLDLVNATLMLTRANGSVLTLEAAQALADTDKQTAHIADVAHVTDSTGMTGTLVDLLIDWRAQDINASGPVHLAYADGRTIDSIGMAYTPKTSIWTFRRATVTVPRTPGEIE